MKYLLILTLDIEPEDLNLLIHKIDPLNIPGFVGPVRLAIDPMASELEEMLDKP